MNRNHLAAWACAMAFGLPLLTAAQAAQTRAGDPTRSAQPATSLRYDSAFKDYKAWEDTRPADWRAVNDALKDGPKDRGHAGHGTAAPAAAGSTPAAVRPAPSPAASAAPVSAPPSAGHGGHSQHGVQK